MRPQSLRTYLTKPDIDRFAREWRRRCVPAFADQRRMLSKLFKETEPETIACMGAGTLSDIPFHDLVKTCETIYLVDWVPELTATALSSVIIDKASQIPRCAYCQVDRETAADYCTAVLGKREGVCEAFRATSTGDCCAFQRGTNPIIQEEDVTGGFVDAFAHRLVEALHRSDGWQCAVKLATKSAQCSREAGSGTSIPDRSVDLVTSSMLISQFVNEPWDFFVHLARKRFGRPDPRFEQRHRAELDRLRDMLAGIQVRRHIDEILRILKPGGRCFISFELFTRESGSQGWRLLEPMNAALRELGNHFEFDFDLIDPSLHTSQLKMKNGDSLVQSHVLSRRD